VPSRAQKPHRSILICTRATPAAPSRNPSPLYRPCLQLEPSAPLSGLVRPAPQLLPATLPPEATQPPPRLGLRTNPRLPSSALMERMRVLWYDFHDFNWCLGDDGRMAGEAIGARKEAWLTIVLVHRGRKDQCPRPHCEVAPEPPERFPEGPQAQRHPSRPLALRLGQAANCPGTPEAHWRRRQGGHCQEPAQHPCREQPIGRATGCSREVQCAHGCAPW